MKTEIWKEKTNTALSSSVPENYERFFVPVIGRPLAEDLIHKADIQPGEKVLDVACGTGIIARLVREKVGRDSSITGLDVNAGMLEMAQSVNGHEKHIEWVEAPAEDMPLDDGRYDVVLCQLSLQFMEDKRTALSEMHRVLTPGGRILLNVPGPVEFLQVLDKAIERHINPQAAGFVARVYSLHKTDEISRLLTEAGFNTISIEEKEKTLNLPAPEDFLWQYVYGTPLAGLFSDTSEEAKKTLENEIAEKWQKFIISGGMEYTQNLIEVSARK
jgi:ubiquinone/menaquinone biosynthesis C-methylase UbiE